MVDLIDDYVKYASSATDAPQIYHLASAYVVASILLGRFTVVYTSYEPEGIRPNIWAILIGPSRIVRKTTAWKHARYVVKSIEPSLIIPASFTPEALYDMFNELNPGDAIFWIKDEFGGFFRMTQKQYMLGLKEILSSSLYSGVGETRKLRSVTLRIPDNLYVCMFATLPTPPHMYISEDDFVTGFMNRFLLVYSEIRDRRIPLLYRSREVEEQRTKLIENYKRFVEHYRPMYPMPLSFTSSASNLIDQYDIRVDEEIRRIESENPSSLWKSYVAESPKLLMKMSAIRRIARDPLSTTAILTIENVDVNRAIKDLEKILSTARDVVEEIQTAAISKPVVTEEKRIIRVFNLIKVSGKKGIKLSELLSKTQITKRELSSILITLIEAERIVAIRPVGTGSPGRRPVIFLSKEHEASVPEIGEELTVDEARFLLER